MSKDQDKPNKPKNNQPQATKKVFDVMRPGKAPASANSRPVIVGHKPQVKEDMFVSSGNSRVAAENPFEKHELMSHGQPTALSEEVKIPSKETPVKETTDALVPRELPSENPDALQGSQPDTADIAKEADEVVTHQEIVFDEPEETPVHPETEAYTPTETPQKPEEPVVQDTAATESPETQEQSPAADSEDMVTDTEPTSSEEKESFSAGQATAAQTSEQPQSSSEEQGAGKLLTQDDVLAATSAPSLDHAFVSHHKAHTKWWEWVLIFLLIIIVGLVALNFLLDAEVISLNIDFPHTNLLK